MQTLVLDYAYRPHKIVSWERAVTLFFLGKVQVVEEYDEEIRSVSISIRMSAVVRLMRAIRGPKRGVRFSRINILARDGWRCQYCSRKLPISRLNYDHVLPRARGGRTIWENIVTACYPCNQRKGDRTPEEAGMRLRHAPTRPAWLPITLLRLDTRDVPDRWATYLYWQTALDEG